MIEDDVERAAVNRYERELDEAGWTVIDETHVMSDAAMARGHELHRQLEGRGRLIMWTTARQPWWRRAWRRLRYPSLLRRRSSQ